MMKKTVATVTMGLLLAGIFSAWADAAKPNPHQSRDQKLRACKKLADDQHLGGDERSTFIAACMKG